GNDRYSTSAANHVELQVNDQRSAPSLERYRGTATAARAFQAVQGVSTSSGSGVLLDAGGDDSYSATAVSTADSNGSASVAANAPSLTAASDGVLADVQGAAALEGQGALVDLGGSDSYSASGSATRTQDGIA